MTIKVHPTATVGSEVELGPGVEIGPNCVLTGRVKIGAKTIVAGHNYLVGPLTIGGENVIYPFTCLGFSPQHTGFAHDQEGPGLTIGDRNVFREHVTIHRATSETEPTRIGDGNWFMVSSHAGHDVQIGNSCVLTNDVLVAGHTILEDNVIFGGKAAIGQRLRVGRLAFVGGGVGMARNVLPFMLARQVEPHVSVNVVGLRRSGMSREEITNVRWAFRTILQQKLIRATAIETLRERADSSSAVREIIAFLEQVHGPILGEGGEYTVDTDADIEVAASEQGNVTS
ncbi:MAG: acyl-ACP--UDP-N-acetylglucosamine O-acyltransferase [Planctomycetota bacterium]